MIDETSNFVIKAAYEVAHHTLVEKNASQVKDGVKYVVAKSIVDRDTTMGAVRISPTSSGMKRATTRNSVLSVKVRQRIVQSVLLNLLVIETRQRAIQTNVQLLQLVCSQLVLQIDLATRH